MVPEEATTRCPPLLGYKPVDGDGSERNGERNFGDGADEVIDFIGVSPEKGPRGARVPRCSTSSSRFWNNSERWCAGKFAAEADETIRDSVGVKSP